MIQNGNPSPHLLRELRFPARYETLAKYLGDELASVLVSPQDRTRDLLEEAAQAILARGEGLFLPIHAPSGTGKTTLANNLNFFLPGIFTPTLSFLDDVTAQTLKAATTRYIRDFPINDEKIIPINIDQREGDGPTGVELAAIKRFLRQQDAGYRALILWPDTSEALSTEMADSYISIAGQAPIDLPLKISGPPQETWIDIAKNTLRLANSLDSLEDLGVDPSTYDPAQSSSVGEYLRKISDDFNKQTLKMIRATRIPLRLAIIFVSESSDAGVLTHLTSSNRFGLLDASALLDASPKSEVGRWWRSRRGLLTTAIVRLDARAFGLSPSASISVLRKFGSQDLQASLREMKVKVVGDDRVSQNLERSDIGKYLLGKSKATFETKGTPTTTSLAAFQLIAELGFTTGKDKALNKAMAQALRAFSAKKDLGFVAQSETPLDFIPIIPDNYLKYEREAICFEYTWRKGEFLVAKNRAGIAQYCLTKIRNYCRELGWIPD